MLTYLPTTSFSSELLDCDLERLFDLDLDLLRDLDLDLDCLEPDLKNEFKV